MNNTEYYEYEKVLYRRILLNNIWNWYERVEKYDARLKFFTKSWKQIIPSEKMEKTYLRQKKLDRILKEYL